MISIELNGEFFNKQIPAKDIIIQACARIGSIIPRFCYQEYLNVAGNCRMCLVELAYPKTLKPVASCAVQVSPNMQIFTNTVLVKKARESVLEFLLINHPLDCPVCDQGGECDLQDETLRYGSDRGRFYEVKRSVEDKDCGPIIKTVMNRCIHCTRCVRFFTDVVGIEFLGTMGRGSFTEIGTFLENLVESEVSGNVIDLCPVGALTSKPYTFNSRSWELFSFQSIDVLDSFCSSIRVDIRGTNILRILPLMNIKSNEEWISDKTRFFFDGLMRQRFQFPLIKFSDLDFQVKCSWEIVCEKIKKLLKFFVKNKDSGLFAVQKKFNNFFCSNSTGYTRILGVCGNLIDCESIMVFKDFLTSLGSNNFFSNLFYSGKNIDFRFNYVAGLSSLNIQQCQENLFFECDLCFLLNFNPRLEMPILNIKLRKAFIVNKLLILGFGLFSSLNCFYFNFINDLGNLVRLLEGKMFFCRKFVKSLRPLILVGSSFLERFDFDIFQNLFICFKKYVNLLVDGWFGFYFIETFVGKLNSFEFGFNNYNFINDNLDFFVSNSFSYLLSSEVSLKFLEFFKNSILVYQGHNGDMFSGFFDLILPSSNFTEKNSSFLNYEGNLKFVTKLLIRPDKVRHDWQIFISVFLFLKKFFVQLKDKYFFSLDYIKGLNFISRISNYTSLFEGFFEMNLSNFQVDILFLEKQPLKQTLFFQSGFFFVSRSTCAAMLTNFFMTDVISRVSSTLALCNNMKNNSKNNNFIYE